MKKSQLKRRAKIEQSLADRMSQRHNRRILRDAALREAARRNSAPKPRHPEGHAYKMEAKAKRRVLWNRERNKPETLDFLRRYS